MRKKREVAAAVRKKAQRKAKLEARRAQSTAIAGATAAMFQVAMEEASRGGDEEDPGSVVEANMNQCAAILAAWCRIFDLGFDFEKALRLTPPRRAMYRHMAVPLAEAMVKKGAMLQMDEARAIMQQRAGQAGR